MNKEAYAEGYQAGVKMALDSCGVVKTAAMPGFLQKALEGASGMPGWAKGMAAGGAGGAGLGAMAGGDIGDILGGAAGGAALGGAAGGGGKALSEAAQGPAAGLLERLGLGSVGAAKGVAREAGQGGAEAVGRLGQGKSMGLPSHLMEQLRGDVMSAGGAQSAAARGVPAAAQSQAQQISPELLKALGMAGGGAGLAGALD